MAWGSPEEIERRNRIRIAVWAYAYEIANDTLVDDAAFDALALQIRPQMSTGRDREDAFFRTEFDPSTGMWIRSHPNLAGIRGIYRRLKAGYPVEAPPGLSTQLQLL